MKYSKFLFVTFLFSIFLSPFSTFAGTTCSRTAGTKTWGAGCSGYGPAVTTLVQETRGAINNVTSGYVGFFDELCTVNGWRTTDDTSCEVSPVSSMCNWKEVSVYTDTDGTTGRPTAAEVIASQGKCNGITPKVEYCDSPTENGSIVICKDIDGGGDQYRYQCAYGGSCPVPAQKWEVQQRPPFCSQHNSAKCGVDGVPLDEYCSSGEIGQTISCMDDVNDTGSCFRFTCKESVVPITGTINVTSNIGGASWTITGPSGQSVGSGLSYATTSQVVGSYSIFFDDVSGYTTPPTQTFTIYAASTSVERVINFEAEYISVGYPVKGSCQQIGVMSSYDFNDCAPITTDCKIGERAFYKSENLLVKCPNGNNSPWEDTGAPKGRCEVDPTCTPTVNIYFQ